MAEKITGPNWEIPETSGRVEFHFPNTTNLAAGYSEPAAVRQYIFNTVIVPFRREHPDVKINLQVNEDLSYVITAIANSSIRLNEECEALLELAYAEGAQMLAY